MSVTVSQIAFEGVSDNEINRNNATHQSFHDLSRLVTIEIKGAAVIDTESVHDLTCISIELFFSETERVTNSNIIR